MIIGTDATSSFLFRFLNYGTLDRCIFPLRIVPQAYRGLRRMPVPDEDESLITIKFFETNQKPVFDEGKNGAET